MRFQAEQGLVKISGRTLFREGVRYLGWSGSAVSFRFRGKRAEAQLLSNPADVEAHLLCRIAVIVRDEFSGRESRRTYMLRERMTTLCLYESEEEKTVTVTLMKYSEAPFAYCGIAWIETDAALLPPPAEKKLKLEIIGDSITCGYGVEAENELVPFRTDTENPELSYSLRLAKLLDADVQLVSWSGNGIVSHYVEETAAAPSDTDLMPEIYPWTDYSCERQLLKEAAASGDASPEEEEALERWNFSAFVPELVLINLGTNDCSWCKDIAERKQNFKAEYKKFLQLIRKLNPASSVLSVLGTMDQRLIEEIRQAVKESAKEWGDGKLHFLELPPQEPSDGYGSDWHPSAETHKKTAEILEKAIREILG